MKLEDEATTSGSSSDDSDDEAPVASTSKATEPFVPTKSVGLVIHPSRMALGDAAESETKVGEKEFNVVCKHWRKGKCGLGSECPFLHEVSLRLSLFLCFLSDDGNSSNNIATTATESSRTLCFTSSSSTSSTRRTAESVRSTRSVLAICRTGYCSFDS